MATEFTFTIADTDEYDEATLLEGCDAALALHNQFLEPVYDENNEEIVPNPNIIPDQASYIQWLMTRTFSNWAHQLLEQQAAARAAAAAG